MCGFLLRRHERRWGASDSRRPSIFHRPATSARRPSHNVQPRTLRAEATGSELPSRAVISNTGRRDGGRSHLGITVPAYVSGLLLAWDDEHQRPPRADRPCLRLEDESGAELPAQVLDRHVGEHHAAARRARCPLSMPAAHSRRAPSNVRSRRRPGSWSGASRDRTGDVLRAKRCDSAARRVTAHTRMKAAMLARRRAASVGDDGGSVAPVVDVLAAHP
jgi:hypothetical protein